MNVKCLLALIVISLSIVFSTANFVSAQTWSISLDPVEESYPNGDGPRINWVKSDTNSQKYRGVIKRYDSTTGSWVVDSIGFNRAGENGGGFFFDLSGDIGVQYKAVIEQWNPVAETWIERDETEEYTFHSSGGSGEPKIEW